MQRASVEREQRNLCFHRHHNHNCGWWISWWWRRCWRSRKVSVFWWKGSPTSLREAELINLMPATQTHLPPFNLIAGWQDLSRKRADGSGRAAAPFWRKDEWRRRRRRRERYWERERIVCHIQWIRLRWWAENPHEKFTARTWEALEIPWQFRLKLPVHHHTLQANYRIEILTISWARRVGEVLFTLIVEAFQIASRIRETMRTRRYARDRNWSWA